MSTEILIYVIIGIIWLVFQVLGKKKKPQKRAQGQPQRAPVTLQDVLKEMDWIPGDRPEPTQPQVVTIPQPDYPRPVARVPSPQPPVVPAVRPHAVPKAALPAVDGATLMKQLRNPESVQTAILLSEILGKPRALNKYSPPGV